MEEHAFSKKDCSRRSTHLGPYRATKLWNDLIYAFRNGMPVGRHWRHMKSHDGCFSASEATTWLHAHLQSNPNFGPNVTRSQTVLLLEKFLKNRIFEDVRQNKNNQDEFTDGGKLFRFIRESPVKGRTPVRVPLSTRTALMNSISSPEISKAGKVSNKEKCKSVDKLSKSFKKKEGRTSSSSTDEKEPSPKEIAKLTALEVENTWKGMVLARLKSVLQLPHLDDILNTSGVNVRYLIHNMTQVNKNGIVTNIDKKDQLPQWVLSAMKCLAYWPVKVEDLPYYDGFDKDVFIVVKDYFLSLEEPLTTFDMYDVFTNVMATLEVQNHIEMPPPMFAPVVSSTSGISPASLNSYTSLENLMADLTMNAQASLTIDPKDVMIVHDPEGACDFSNMPDLVRTHSRKLSKYSSASSLPSAKLETSFGVNGDEPKTKVVIKPGGQFMSLNNSGMVAPGSASSSNSASRVGIRNSMASDLSCNSANRSAANKSRASIRSDMSCNSATRSAADKSRASIRSAGSVSNSSTTRYQSQCSQYSDRSSQRGISVSSARNSVNDRDSVFFTTPEYNISNVSSRSNNSHHNSASQAPRTCPEQGSYTKVTNSCVNLLNNVVAQSLPSYMPPPLCENTVNNSSSSKYQPNHTNHSINGVVQHRSSANDSASSYDTACSHLSNRDSMNLGNGSNTGESVGNIGGVNVTDNTRSSSVFSSAEVKWPASSPPPIVPPPVEFSSQSSRFPQRENLAFQSPKLQLYSSRFGPAAAPAALALQESYRMAMETDRNMPTLTPVGRSLFGRTVRKSESSPNLHQFASPPPKNRTLEALQICTLMLPPANRRKLHLLLRLMHKMVNNMELRLDGAKPTRALVLDTFSRCIIRSPEEVDFNEMLCVQVVAFMMDNYTDLMTVPNDLKARIEDRIVHLRKTKSPPGWVSPPSRSVVVAGVAVHDPSNITYCDRVSLQDYESQKLSTSQAALADLLDDIVRDKQLSSKDKKKRLKQFQKHYPEIYSRRFPSVQSEAELFPNKPRIKPPLLARPLHKLRSLRL